MTLPVHRLKVALVEPEIPQNTGNIARLCAATGAALHLVRPLGFFLNDKSFRRAGMDYVQNVAMTVHDDLAALMEVIGDQPIWLTTGLELTPPAQSLWRVKISAGDWLFFGKETAGLPAELLQRFVNRTVQIPMQPGTRGLNVSTAAGIVLYEALRQVTSCPG